MQEECVIYQQHEERKTVSISRMEAPQRTLEVTLLNCGNAQDEASKLHKEKKTLLKHLYIIQKSLRTKDILLENYEETESEFNITRNQLTKPVGREDSVMFYTPRGSQKLQETD